MIINIKYLDSPLVFSENEIMCLEVGNKNYLYRIMQDIIILKNGEQSENIECFDLENNEINISNKINLITNFFEFDFNDKKTITKINKDIQSQTSEETKNIINDLYRKLVVCVTENINNIDYPVIVNNEYSLEDVIKLLKLKIKEKDNLLDNILLLIDLESELFCNSLVVLLNVKQYLTTQQIDELYKYAVYNKVNLLLIESNFSKIKHNYEIKKIIDENLEEF